MTEEARAFAIKYLNEVVIPIGWDELRLCQRYVQRGRHEGRCRKTVHFVVIHSSPDRAGRRGFFYSLVCGQHSNSMTSDSIVGVIQLTAHQIREGTRCYQARTVAEALTS